MKLYSVVSSLILCKCSKSGIITYFLNGLDLHQREKQPNINKPSYSENSTEFRSVYLMIIHDYHVLELQIEMNVNDPHSFWHYLST